MKGRGSVSSFCPQNIDRKNQGPSIFTRENQTNFTVTTFPQAFGDLRLQWPAVPKSKPWWCLQRENTSELSWKSDTLVTTECGLQSIHSPGCRRSWGSPYLLKAFTPWTPRDREKLRKCPTMVIVVLTWGGKQQPWRRDKNSTTEEKAQWVGKGQWVLRPLGCWRQLTADRCRAWDKCKGQADKHPNK